MASATLGVAVCAAIIGETVAGDRMTAFRQSWWTMVAIMALGPLLLWWRYPSVTHSEANALIGE